MLNGYRMEWSYAIAFRDTVHRELRPLIMPAMEYSHGAEHFRDKMQLRALYFNLIELSNQIAREEVICRNKKVRTARHIRICSEADEAFENLRQLAVQFNLSH